MDFLGNVFGGQGCSVDGTATNNPVNAMVNQLFDSQISGGNDDSIQYSDSFLVHQQDYREGKQNHHGSIRNNGMQGSIPYQQVKIVRISHPSPLYLSCFN